MTFRNRAEGRWCTSLLICHVQQNYISTKKSARNDFTHFYWVAKDFMRCPPGRILIPTGQLRTFVFLRISFFMEWKGDFFIQRRTESRGPYEVRARITIIVLVSHIFCFWEPEHFLLTVHGKQNGSDFMFLGGKLSHIFCPWDEDYFIYPVHGRQNMGGKLSHISCSWEAWWWSGWAKVAGVPIAGQEEY